MEMAKLPKGTLFVTDSWNPLKKEPDITVSNNNLTCQVGSANQWKTILGSFTYKNNV